MDTDDEADAPEQAPEADAPYKAPEAGAEPALFGVWSHFQVWYSENYPKTDVEEVRGWLAEWYADEAAAEAWVAAGAERLDRMIRTARLLWAWYGLPEAARLLERAMHLAETLRGPDGALLHAPFTVREAMDRRPLYLAVWEPGCVHVLAWDLAEIAEAAGQEQEAIRRYTQFLAREPELDPVVIPKLDEWYYYHRRTEPTTVEGLRRIGHCFRRAGDIPENIAAARAAWEAALTLNWSPQTPFAELAELSAAEGDGAAALRWRERALRVGSAQQAENLAEWRALGQAWLARGEAGERLRCGREIAALASARRYVSLFRGELETRAWIGDGEVGALRREAEELEAEAARAQEAGGDPEPWLRQAEALLRLVHRRAPGPKPDLSWLAFLRRWRGPEAAIDGAIQMIRRFKEPREGWQRAQTALAVEPYLRPLVDARRGLLAVLLARADQLRRGGGGT